MEKGDQIPNALGLLININKCEGEDAILGKHTHGWAHLSRWHIKTHIYQKKYHNVSSGVSPKAENEVQQQMSAFVRWPGVVRWRKQASGECLITESDPKFFPQISGNLWFYFFEYKKKSLDWCLMRLVYQMSHQTGLRIHTLNQRCSEFNTLLQGVQLLCLKITKRQLHKIFILLFSCEEGILLLWYEK